MKLQREIAHITVFFKSLFVNKQIIGILGLIIAYAIFLIEIIEFVGFNSLRVIFSIIAVANFCLLLFSIFQNYWIRVCGSAIYLLLLWSNVLNFRFFGSTMHFGALLNIGFLPVLGSQVLFMIQWFDGIYLLSFISGIIFFKNSPKSAIQKRIPQIIFFAGVLLILQVFLYFAATQSSLNSAKKYNESFTRWDIYKDIRFMGRDHTGSVLYFGFLWTYGADLYRMNKKPNQVEPIPESNFSIQMPPEKQRNIIAIQVESLDKHIIYHTVDDKPVMPFLRRLTKESAYFSNVFAQHTSVGGTSDAEFCVLTSQYPLGYKGTFFALGLEQLPSIPAILNRNGFATLAFHGNSGSLFNRKQGLLGLGFKQTFFKNDFTLTDPDKWHALKDKDFLHQVQQTLTSTKPPYFAFVLTLTSHTPFNLIDENDYVSNFDAEDPLVRNYLNSMAYVDLALDEFITAMLRSDPKAVIILFGDHCANIHEAEYTSYEIKGLEPIPLFILDSSNQTNKEFLIAGSTIDIGPTLFDYLGVEIPTFWQGKSLLDEQNNKNTFILNSSNYFDANGILKKLSEGSVDSEELYRIQKYIW